MSFNTMYQVNAQPNVGSPEDSILVDGISNQFRTTNDLGTAFSLVGHEISVRPQVKFRIVLEGQSQPLHPVIYEHAYRIGREALLNAFRHSQASRIDLYLEHTPAKLSIAIRDNGKGITADLTCVSCDGLSWMKELAEQIGAKLKLLSRVRAGTEVSLSIPAYVAFASEARRRLQLAAA
jgi:signal transduction histidine kinase